MDLGEKLLQYHFVHQEFHLGSNLKLHGEKPEPGGITMVRQFNVVSVSKRRSY
jgi:hypothetical protein